MALMHVSALPVLLATTILSLLGEAFEIHLEVLPIDKPAEKEKEIIIPLEASWVKVGQGCCKRRSKDAMMIYNSLAPSLHACQAKCEMSPKCGYVSFGWKESTWCRVMPREWDCDKLERRWCGHDGAAAHTYHYDLKVAGSVPKTAEASAESPSTTQPEAQVWAPSPSTTRTETTAISTVAVPTTPATTPAQPAPQMMGSPCSTMPPDISQFGSAVPLVKVGKCSGIPNGWGKVGDCLSNQPQGNFAGGYTWHCPWESMMLMATKQWGGCPNVKIDCESTSYKDILQLYSDHSSKESGPPEGDLRTVKYAACCVRHNCEDGPACGDPPWDATKDKSTQLPPGVSPCGTPGCERLYALGSAIAWPPAMSSTLVAYGTALAATVGALSFALAVLRFRRQTSLERGASSLSEADEEALEELVE